MTEEEAQETKKKNTDINRFLRAQEGVYETALAEVKAGHKRTHWIWYIFPQMRSLGHSRNSYLYGIKDREEAKEYIANPVLRDRLVEITQAVLDSEHSVYDIFGDDVIKVRSCMKLFASVSDIPVFKKLMAKYGWH